MCGSGKGPATSTPPRDRRSAGWRPSPAIARSTKSAAFARRRWKRCRRDFEPAAESVDPLAARARSERLAALLSCLGGLDSDKREAVLLAYYRGFSREALAKRFGAPAATIKTWLRRSLMQLRDCLEIMTLAPDDDFAAAEFALGTLDAAERATLAARRRREPELDAAIRAWEARLSPLAEATAPIVPPADFLPAIEARIRLASPAPDAVATLQKRLARWRAAAIGATGIAAALAIGVATREATRPAAPGEFVAVLQKSPDSPAFVATVNLAKGELSVRAVAAPPQAGKSYELWIIEPKLGAPRSLGVLDAAAVTRSPRLAGYDRAVVEDATYAVTVEPKGGSPDGKPSGPPVFVGKLIAVEP